MAYFVVFGIQNHDESVALVHGGGYALFQSVFVLVAHHHLVDNYFDVVVLVAVQFHAVYHFAYLSVHTDIQIAFLAYLFEEFLVMALTGAYKGCKDVYPLAHIVFPNQTQNLFFGVFYHLLAGKV